VGSWGLAMPVPDGNGREGRSLLSLRRVVAAKWNVKQEAVTRFRELSDTIWHAFPSEEALVPPYGGTFKAAPYECGFFTLILHAKIPTILRPYSCPNYLTKFFPCQRLSLKNNIEKITLPPGVDLRLGVIHLGSLA
jgi:hypothetical protein